MTTFPLKIALCDGYDWDNRSTNNGCIRTFNSQEELDWARYRRESMPRIYDESRHGYQPKKKHSSKNDKGTNQRAKLANKKPGSKDTEPKDDEPVATSWFDDPDVSPV